MKLLVSKCFNLSLLNLRTHSCAPQFLMAIFLVDAAISRPKPLRRVRLYPQMGRTAVGGRQFLSRRGKKLYIYIVQPGMEYFTWEKFFL